MLEALVGGRAAGQGLLRRDHAQGKGTTTLRQRLVMRRCRHHHDFDGRVGLQGDGVERLLQSLPVKAADDHRDQRAGAEFGKVRGGGTQGHREHGK